MRSAPVLKTKSWLISLESNPVTLVWAISIFIYLQPRRQPKFVKKIIKIDKLAVEYLIVLNRRDGYYWRFVSIAHLIG